MPSQALWSTPLPTDLEHRPHRPPPFREQWHAGHIEDVVRGIDQRSIEAPLGERCCERIGPAAHFVLRKDGHPKLPSSSSGAVAWRNPSGLATPSSPSCLKFFSTNSELLSLIPSALVSWVKANS